jgi:hypothetical protein
LAFFFAAILFSSPLFEIRASEAGGARIQFPCIVSARNLVKRKVIAAAEKVKTQKQNDRSSTHVLAPNERGKVAGVCLIRRGSGLVRKGLRPAIAAALSGMRW